MRALYLCYFGLREPLVQTQVLPYLRELVGGDVEMHLLTFEPGGRAAWPADEERVWRERLRTEGIAWSWLRYHKRPTLPATAWDILRGAVQAALVARRKGIGILHARSHVAGIMGALARLLTGSRLIFDIRGVLAEEYVDAGRWKRGGLLYRLTSWGERWLLRRADGFVVLTEEGRRLLLTDAEPVTLGGKPVEVIPCCFDPERFRPSERPREELRRSFGIPLDARVLIYVGGLGGWYLTEELVDVASVSLERDPRSFLVVLTHSDSRELVRLLDEREYPKERSLVTAVQPNEIPAWLQAADVGLSLIRPSYSKRFSSPTKLAEYLASGVPVLTTQGVGDVDQFLESERVGVTLAGLDRESMRQALCRIDRLLEDPETPVRCRRQASERFDLSRIGGIRYLRLYDVVASQRRGAPRS